LNLAHLFRATLAGFVLDKLKDPPPEGVDLV
jgi:hypothetical protein